MDFFTPVGLPSGLPPLVQADNLLLMGSWGAYSWMLNSIRI